MSTATLLANPDDDDPGRRCRLPLARTKAGGTVHPGDLVTWTLGGRHQAGHVVRGPGWPDFAPTAGRADGTRAHVWVQPQPFMVPVDDLTEPPAETDGD